MKNETARREIESLDYYLQNHTNDYSEKSHTAMMMAIEALKQEPKLATRWIDADLDPNFAKCKKCSEHKVDIAYSKDFIKQERWNFCPYCGAKIDNGGDTE